MCRRLRIISKSYGIEKYDVTSEEWDALVAQFESSQKSIYDLQLQEQCVNQEAYYRGDYPTIIHWETIAEFSNMGF
jgi:hypothetical protein